jgi:hypothetical protein
MANRGERLFEGTISLDIPAKGSDAQNALRKIRNTQDFGTLIAKSLRIFKTHKMRCRCPDSRNENVNFERISSDCMKTL